MFKFPTLEKQFDHLFLQQDDNSAINDNKDPLSFDGMADAEVERRLKVSSFAGSLPSLQPPSPHLPKWDFLLNILSKFKKAVFKGHIEIQFLEGYICICKYNNLQGIYGNVCLVFPLDMLEKNRNC